MADSVTVGPRRDRRLQPAAADAEGEVKKRSADVLPSLIADLKRMVASGELTDGFLLAAYPRATAKGVI
jgi:hypothetical protein